MNLSRILSVVLCVSFVLAGFSCAPTGDPSTQPSLVADEGRFFVRESDGSAGKHKYSIFVPRGYDAHKKYPAIVFLHGMGESGDDGEKCRTVGLGPAIDRRKKEFDFIAIFPQNGSDWTTPDAEKIALDAIYDVEKNFSIDQTRIALTGLSTGGKGTWVLGARHPEIFSCLVPVCAQKAEEVVPRLKHYPIWAFHNDGDGFVNANETRDMINPLKSAGANPRLTLYHSGDHNCWDKAYGERELYEWMKGQKRMK